MGNQQTVSCDIYPENNHSQNKLSKLSKFKFNKWKAIKDTKNKPIPKSNDQFFIKHIQNNKNEIDIHCLDQRRHIYISLIGLYQTWKQIPHVSLYSALFMLPLKKEWIFDPSQYTNEIQSNPLLKLSMFSDDTETEEFIELLKWKHNQGLIMWMLDYENYNNNEEIKCDNALIHPFWYHFNNKLCSLWDPITNNNYKPLNLDVKWWQNKKQFISKYNTKTSSILSEFYFLTKKFDTISEIIYQSNPKSLHSMKSYTLSTPATPLKKNINIYESDDEDNENWTECDYDPYDLTQYDIDNGFEGIFSIN